MKPNRIDAERFERQKRQHDARVRALFIIALVLLFGVVSVRCMGHTHPPVEYETYPVESFSGCASCIVHIYTARGHRCEAYWCAEYDCIVGHVDGAGFCLTYDDWASYKGYIAEPLVPIIERRLAMELAIASLEGAK